MRLSSAAGAAPIGRPDRSRRRRPVPLPAAYPRIPPRPPTGPVRPPAPCSGPC